MKHNTSPTSYLMPCFLVLLQGFLYGLGDPISKAAYDVVPVYALLSIRYLLALLLLLLCAGKRITKGLKRCSPRDWLPPSLCMGSAYLTGNIALQLTAATSVAFLRSLSTVMTPLLALLIYKRKFGVRHILVQIMVIVGLYLLCGLGGLSEFGAGELFALLSALLLTGSLVFGENALDRIDPLTLSALQTASSLIMASICMVIFNSGWQLKAVTPQIWLIIAYLAVCCTIAGYVFQNAALAKISSRTVALLQCLCPMMTAFFSRVILKERLTLPGTIGACIILGCVTAETLIKDPISEKEKNSS